MTKGEFVVRWRPLALTAVLALTAGITLLSHASVANGAAGHDHHHSSITQGGDPSLGLKVGDKGRFSKAVSVTGEILAVEAHDPENGHPYLKLLVTRDDQMYGLYGRQSVELKPGKRYELSGLLDPSPANFQAAASADILVSGAKGLPMPRQARSIPPLSRTGKAGFIMAYVTWPGSGPTMFDQDAAQAKGLTEWSSTVSNGQFSWDPVEMVEIQLAEPLAACPEQSPAPPGESQIPAWVQTVRGALEGEGYDLRNDYRALGIAFPENASICSPGAAAYAFMGYIEKFDYQCEWYGSDSWCNLSIYGYGGTSFPTIAHELGHTFGLPHANSMQCRRDDSPVVIDYARGCLRLEYGDRFDVMGGVGYSGKAPYNSAFSDRLGWIKDTEADRLPLSEKAEREVTLSPFAGNSGVRLFQTELPLMPSEGGLRSPGKVYAEYRTRVGLDSTLYPGSDWLLSPCREGVSDAVYLRVVPNGLGANLLGVIPPEYPEDPFWPESYVLDTKPETVFLPDLFGLCDAGLQPGDSWEDPTGKLRIDFLRRPADLSTAIIKVRSAGAEEERPTLELEKVGQGTGKVIIAKAGVECEDRCTHRLDGESRIAIRAVPARGSVFRFWMGDCGEFATNPVCELDARWGQKKVIKAGFDPDPNFPRPDINLSTIQLTPANLKVKAGKKARLTVRVTNSGLDEGDARVSLSSSSPAKAKVPGSVSFKVPGESSATGSFTVTTKKKQKGKVTITARLGSQTARANLVLAR